MSRVARWILTVVWTVAIVCSALAQDKVVPPVGTAMANVAITHVDRTVLGEDVVHYRFDVRVGPGKFKEIRLHRIVREPHPYRPIDTFTGVLLLPGAPNTVEMIFMAPLISAVPAWDHSIAI